MNGSDHERARELLLLRDVEGISSGDAVWLDSHVGGCADCSVFAEELELTARALRSLPVTASASLVTTTQARVRQRAAELRDHQARVFLIGISFGLGLLWSAGSAFVGWKLSAWAAERIHVAPWIVAASFITFWLAPAVAVAIGLLLRHPLSYGGRTDWMAARVEEESQ